MLIEISNGELVDKVSILEIKNKKIAQKEKRKNVEKEYTYLKKKMKIIGIRSQSKEYKNLFEINLKIWNLEDKIRQIEKKKNFGDEFINLARSIYFQNDKRAILKKQINIKTNSLFSEEKELPNYK
ncbi:hypothetical protein COV77_00985 [Candidatus Pacearchaeota archaeon CG11_big_fil_rev_8_21_14_0_20_30_13]|nr:MAG: hypothetical protein COV77_00985 [Candidatus Pacearchaeota archaeon CG11_big_fil_rev_8_21_14_0_20_30_13]PIZ81856.1 MAG: hypothetical protein COX98_02120 [Candidatus Pacearchaeota archaeon CG_4_10_14_0_2_um_filter_30_11]